MRRGAQALLILTLLLAGCSGSASDDSYQLSEFEITGPSALNGGAHTLAVTNSGDLPHTLVVTDSSGGVVAATSLIQPGEDAVLDVDLSDGRYVFTCRIVAQNDEGEIVDHYEAGMTRMVEVAG